MKNIYKLLFAGLLVAFVGCSSDRVALGEGAASIEDEVLESQGLEGAPSWVLMGGSKEGLSAIGIADITKAGLQFARTEALAKARDELARIIEVKVEGIVSDAMEQSIGNNAFDANVEKFGEQVTRQIVNQSLSGSKQKDTWISKKNQIFVLVELDSALNEKSKKMIMQNISKTSGLNAAQKKDFSQRIDAALDNLHVAE